MSRPYESELLGLFPILSQVGGIEASGRIAWEGITNGKGSELDHLDLFEYGADGPNGAQGLNRNGSTLSPSSSRAKATAIVRALNTRSHPRKILVWHLGLLKLVPFFRAPAAEVILYLHGIEAWKSHGLLTKRNFKRVKLFLSNSDFTWSRFLEYYPELQNTRHIKVALGIGSPIGGALPPPGDTPIALMIGRLNKDEAYKGHREVIGAWSQVLTRIPQARLEIVGDGGWRTELEAWAQERGVSDSVKFWGTVSDAQKDELLQQSRCLALPSRSEGFGLVYLEAMRLGRPCLVSDVDAGREVVNPPEAGLAAAPDDEAALADALVRLLTDGPEWQRWSTQARQRYEQNYTAAHFQQRLLAALGPGELSADYADSKL